MSKRKLATVLLVFLVVGAACSPTPTPTFTPIPTSPHTPIPAPSPTATLPQSISELHYHLDGELTTLDPALAQSEAEVDVVKQLLVGLTAYDPEAGAPKPELATHWDVSTDGRVYTFYLRCDVLWVRYHPESGLLEPLRPVNAHDVVYSLRRAVHPATGAPDAHLLYLIQNARAIHTTPITGTCNVKSLGVAALDDHTVRFTLAHPAAYLPTILALPVAHPVRPELPPDVYQWPPCQQLEDRYLITNGPYVLTACAGDLESTTLSGIHMWANPEFDLSGWMRTELLDLFLASRTTAMALYERGELDSATIPAEILYHTSRPDPLLAKELYVVPTGGVRYFGFNLSKPPLDNVHVRRAFSYALDRHSISWILEDGSALAGAFAPPGVFGSMPRVLSQEFIQFDRFKARDELIAAGYSVRAPPARGGLSRVTLLHPSTELDAAIAISAQRDWDSYLGVEVVLIGEDEWRADPQRQPPHIWLGHWQGEYPDQHVYVHDLLRSEPWTGFNGDVPVIKPLLDLTAAASVELDTDKRRDMYHQVEDLLINDICALAVLSHDGRIVLTKPYVHRDYPIMGGQNFKDWRVDRP